MAVPASRYRCSSRRFPETLPAIEYASTDSVRKVQNSGVIHYQGREWRVGKAFEGYPVALRNTSHDGVLEVVFCNERLGYIDQRSPEDNVRILDPRKLPVSTGSKED